MNTVNTEIVDALYHAQSEGTLDIAGIIELPDISNAQRLQLEVLQRRVADGEEVAGWKVAFTSGTARRDPGEDSTKPFGNIVASHVFASQAEIELPAAANWVIEAEIALRIGVPLAGNDVSPEMVRSSVAEVLPVFEVCAQRIPGGSPLPLLLADNLKQWGVVVGDTHGTLPEDLTTTQVDLSHDGQLIASESMNGRMDDPYASVAALCRSLGLYGMNLEPGQIVLTGAFCRSIEKSVKGSWQAIFGTWGEVAGTFS
jgi:2-keto-4-pentenoate hydratase